MLTKFAEKRKVRQETVSRFGIYQGYTDEVYLDTSPLEFSFLPIAGIMSFPPVGTWAPKAVSVSRSDACALSPPVGDGEALITATGLP